jgi:hypothetical protein
MSDMSLSLPDLITRIEAKQYRTAADLLMAAGAVADHQRDPAMVAAMIGTCHLSIRKTNGIPIGTIRELVIDRMVFLRWLKRDAFDAPALQG